MGKGSNTTTTSQQQTYAPAGASYVTGALNQAQNAAQLPFNIPQAPVAGFSQDQQAAFGNINAAQGMAQPYINQAQQYFSPQGAQQFLNPYAANVMAGMKDVFGQQQSQQQGQLTQAAGGVGADRIAVGQSELAKQQGLAAGQTLSGLYGNAVQQAQSAGYGTAALGNQAQNAALSGAQAQLASGGLQQQLQQAQMNSPYQQQLAQAQFPYQQAQFLAGITGALAPGLGGTTTGQGTQTTPAPSLFSQILGGGTAALGAIGGAGGFGGGKGSGSANTPGWASAQLQNNAGSPYYGPGFARGGPAYSYAEGGETESSPFDLPPNFNDDPINIAEKSIIPQVQTPAIQTQMPQLNLTPQKSGDSGGGGGGGIGDIAKLAMMFINRGGRVPNNPYAQGGAVFDDRWNAVVPDTTRDTPADPYLGSQALRDFVTAPTQKAGWEPVGPMSDARRKQVLGYAEGGAADEDDPSPASFEERFPYRGASVEGMEAWRNDAPAPPAMAYAGDDRGDKAFPPPPGAHGRSVGAPTVETPPDAPQDVSARSRSPVAPPPQDAGRRERFIDSPWAALMAAGLGIAGGTSPFAGVNIGQGAMAGLKTLEAQRASGQKDETIAQATRRLDLEAKHHEDQYTRMTPYQQAQVGAQEREGKLKALQPVQIGQNTYGQPIYAKRNPKTGEYEVITLPGQTEPPVPPATQSAPPAPAAATDNAVLPAGATPTQGLLPSGTFKVEPPSPTANPTAIEGMRPADANLVRAIAEGRQQFLPLSRNNPYNRYIMEKVHEYDQNVDQTAYSRRSRTANFFAVGTQGGGGQNIASMNTFGQHADELLRLSKKLNLGEYPTWNAVKNALARQGFDDKEIQDTLGAWQVASKAVSDEGAKVFAGTNSALADREAWGSMFDASNPKSVTRSKLKEVVKLIDGRLSSLANQYNEGMRTDHDKADFIAPRTREVFNRILSDKPETPAAGAAPSAAAAPAAAGPKVGERKQFKQGWGVWNGTSYVPEGSP